MTLSVGVLVSMFTALVVTRVLLELRSAGRRLAPAPRLLGLERSAGGLATGSPPAARTCMRPGPPVAGRLRWSRSLLAGTGLVVRGLNFGVEFTGGRLLEYGTERPVDLDGPAGRGRGRLPQRGRAGVRRRR